MNSQILNLIDDDAYGGHLPMKKANGKFNSSNTPRTEVESGWWKPEKAYFLSPLSLTPALLTGPVMIFVIIYL